MRGTARHERAGTAARAGAGAGAARSRARPRRPGRRRGTGRARAARRAGARRSRRRRRARATRRCWRARGRCGRGRRGTPRRRTRSARARARRPRARRGGVDGRTAVHGVGDRERAGGAGRDERGERERVDALAQRARGQHVGGVDAGRGEREQRAREVDGAEAAARDEQADAGDRESERGRAAAREALAAEHDRAGHHEHRVAVGDDAGGAGAHPLDRGQVGRRGGGVGRRAERDGDQRDAQTRQRAAAGPAARSRARSAPSA